MNSKTVAAGLLVLAGWGVYALYVKGGLQPKTFSHDLSLLNYQGAQYTLKLPAYYRLYKRLRYQLWYEVYDRGMPPKQIRSFRPEGGGMYSTRVIPRRLPLDILLQFAPDGTDTGRWTYKALLNMGGGFGALQETPESATSGVMISAPGSVRYREGRPILLAEMVLGKWSMPQDTRLYRWYLQVELTNKEPED